MKSGKSARRKTTASSKPERSSALGQHRARCRICRHPDREEIEREFLDWTSPREIAATWKLASYRGVYRHAHATGLFEQRRNNWQGALERIIERVSEVKVTAGAVVAAVRLSVQIERERNHAAKRQPQPRFALSFEGLPRTDAVTGVARPVQRPEPVPVNNGGDGPRKVPEAGTNAARRDAAPAPEKDPRFSPSEDGRVAGVPWPWKEKKLAFAPRRRWRPTHPSRE